MTDFDNKFLAIFAGLNEIYSKEPSKNKIKIYKHMLGGYQIEQIQKAVNYWVRSSKFYPTPHDLLSILDRDPKLTADEAWGVACNALDEFKTVIWCDEIAKAWDSAKVIVDYGDMIGARRVFIDTYNSLMRDAEINGKKIKFTVSYGIDKAGRDEAIKTALNKGLLTQEQAVNYLPNLADEAGTKLIGVDKEFTQEQKQMNIKKMKDLMSIFGVVSSTKSENEEQDSRYLITAEINIGNGQKIDLKQVSSKELTLDEFIKRGSKTVTDSYDIKNFKCLKVAND